MNKTKYAIINKQIADILAIAREKIDVTKIKVYGEKVTVPYLLMTLPGEPIKDTNNQFWNNFEGWLKVVVRKNQTGARGGRCRNSKPYISFGTRYLTPFGGWNFREPTTGQTTQQGSFFIKKGRQKKYNKNSDMYNWITVANKTNQGWFCKTEYTSIAKDPEIGSYFSKNSDYRIPLALMLCHELAHAIDYAINANGNHHQEPWQDIYRILRNNYVNNLACIQDEPKTRPTNIVKFKPRQKTTYKTTQLNLFEKIELQTEVA